MRKQEYRVVIEGLEEEMIPCHMAGCKDAHDAAQSFAIGHIQDTQGSWRKGAVKVWNVEDDGKTGESTVIFDVRATITPCQEEDAEEGDMNCELELWQRE